MNRANKRFDFGGAGLGLISVLVVRFVFFLKSMKDSLSDDHSCFALGSRWPCLARSGPTRTSFSTVHLYLLLVGNVMLVWRGRLCGLRYPTFLNPSTR
jgi:hypothetical protein